MASLDYARAHNETEPPALRGSALSTAAKALIHIAWPFTWPLRWYWSHSKNQFGKKLLVDRVLKSLLSASSSEFEAELSGGGRVLLERGDDIGLVVLLTGSYEPAETACARELAVDGSVAIDVGANVGMFTVPLAMAVGPRGRVLAVEPAPENVRRLVQNLEINALDNVDVHGVAVTQEEGEVLLQLGADPAFHSTSTVVKARETLDCACVRAQTLDGLWEDAGSPEVSFLKVDTEGGELDVLAGGTKLLRACHPSILVEAKELDACLLPWGYERTRRRGFAVGNYLYVPAA
jgi:FkbM family methyltransferase